jgi:hypothetical protein
MVLANAAALIAIVLSSWSHRSVIHFRTLEDWVGLGFILGLAGNVLYIVLYPRREEKARTEKPRKSRIRTIVGLWFDAKERELRDRAGK